MTFLNDFPDYRFLCLFTILPENRFANNLPKVPFTFSHPAVVLPLGALPRRWISLSGLVAGSVAPDFEYFLRLKAITLYSHTWKGIFWFDLPLAVALILVFHLIIKKPLIGNLPDFVSCRLTPFIGFDWLAYFRKHIPVVVLSAVLGAASHILWDGFTHENGIFLSRFPWLSREIHLPGKTILVYSLLQYLSSAAGAVFILALILRLPKDRNFEPNNAILHFWFSVGLVSLVVVATRFFAGLGSKPAANLIVAAVAGACAGIFFTSLVKGIEFRKE